MKEIQILNHNMYFKPIGFNTNPNEYKRERANLYPCLVKHFDILLLQECFKSLNPGYMKFISDLKDVGFKYMTIGSSPDFSSK